MVLKNQTHCDKKNTVRKVKFKQQINRILSAMLSVIIIVTSEMNVYAEQSEYKSELKQNVTEVTKMIEEIFQNQYDAKKKELESIILENNYDVTMTMETFYDNGNPYTEVDYIDLISIYTAAKEYCLEKGLDVGNGFSNIPFLEMTVEEKVIEELQPELVEEYELTEEGYYARTGNRVVKDTEVVGIYEEIEMGKYEKVGEKTISPETVNITYGDVQLRYAGNDCIYDAFSISENEVKNSYLSKKTIIDEEVNGTALSQSVFVHIPEFEMDVETEAVLERLTSNIKESGQAAIIETAISLIGKVPYEWGGKAKHGGYDNSWWLYNENGVQNGLDCSGFVQWVYMTLGYDKEITDSLLSTGVMLEKLEDTTYENLEPGDIGLLNMGESTNHAGIYLGEGYFIHCSSGKNTVVVNQYPFRYFKKVSKKTKKEVDIDTVSNYDDSEYTKSVIDKSELPKEGQNSNNDESNSTNLVNEHGQNEETKNNEYYNSKDSENVISTETPEAGNESVSEKSTDTKTENDEDSIILLAKLIHHEAGNQGYNGKVAVGEVVMNRLRNGRFGNTIEEVIYAKNQFADVEEVANMEINDEDLSIARLLWEGKISILNNDNVLFFKNPKITNGIEPTEPVDWGSYQWYTNVNDHAFYLGK